MPTLGEELRRMRDERHITLTEISEATRIGTRFLKAIESDNFSVLPGGIFTRSFIRAYAKQVGMGEDEAISRYQQQVTGVPAESPAESATESRESASPPEEIKKENKKKTTSERPKAKIEPVAVKQEPSRTNWAMLLIAGAGIFFVVMVVLGVMKRLNNTEHQPVSQQASAPRQADPPKATQPSATGSAATSSPDSKPAQTPNAQSSATPAAPPSANGQPLMVSLEATTTDSAIQYWVDGAPKATSFILKKGESQNLPAAQSQIKLAIGNRPTLKMKINNRDAIFPEGTPNWGAKVTISRDNLQTFFQ
jgi:cytoskeletal protein RodZ